jgi:hypothetical protein
MGITLQYNVILYYFSYTHVHYVTYIRQKLNKQICMLQMAPNVKSILYSAELRCNI